MRISKKEQKKADFLKILKNKFGMIQLSCEAADICRQTYRNWYNDDAEFRAKVDEIFERNKDFAESALLVNIKKGISSDIHFYLERKARDRGYGKNVSLEISEGQRIELGDIEPHILDSLEWEDE